MERMINLSNFRTNNARVFSGRDRGEAVRNALGDIFNSVEELEKVRVQVPNDVMSLNDSFFLGLFGDTVRDLGENRFRTIFTFECTATIMKDVDDGIKQALKEKKVI